MNGYTLTLEEMLRTTESFFASSISAGIASSIGLLGLLLASIGIYSTVSYLVVLRTREAGIRMALGARKLDVLTLMLRESARPVVVGLCVGVCLALGASYLLRGVLYGLNAIDSISFVGVSALFLSISLFAAYVPSRRATRVDPWLRLDTNSSPVRFERQRIRISTPPTKPRTLPLADIANPLIWLLEVNARIIAKPLTEPGLVLGSRHLVRKSSTEEMRVYRFRSQSLASRDTLGERGAAASLDQRCGKFPDLRVSALSLRRVRVI